MKKILEEYTIELLLAIIIIGIILIWRFAPIEKPVVRDMVSHHDTLSVTPLDNGEQYRHLWNDTLTPWITDSAQPGRLILNLDTANYNLHVGMWRHMGYTFWLDDTIIVDGPPIYPRNCDPDSGLKDLGRE